MRALLVAVVVVVCACAKKEAPGVAVEVPVVPAPSVDVEKPKGRAFDVGLSPSGAYVANQPATAIVSIRAREGFHVNPEYPVKFTASSDGAVAFATPTVALLEVLERTPCAEHAEDTCLARAPLAFSVTKAGPAKVAGTLALSVCNADQCLIEKVPLSLDVVVAPK